ncbi:MAG: DNA replication complex subunit Gins51 [Candidatus Thorarchaeota archaeon]
MSDLGYSDIQAIWKSELENEGLQDLGDLRLSKMVSYLSSVRLSLAALDAEERIQADILTQEALNLEFMIEDLLELRKQKILKSAMSGHRPRGDMTLSEEDFYNRFQSSLDGHTDFVKESLAGTPTPTKKKTKKKKQTKKKKPEPPSDTEEVDYVYVRFLTDIKDQVMGIDEKTYGPFKKESVVRLPAANVSHWIRDGTVVRFVPEEDSE